MKHPLGRIRVMRTRGSAIPFEVVDQCARVRPDVTVVNGLATTREEKKPVEGLEENSRWLMNRA